MTLCFMSRFWPRVSLIVTCSSLLTGGLLVQAADMAIDPKKPVSFHKHIRPIFEANCQGCHQPAKDKGGYVMTDFRRLLGAGDSGKVAVEPKKPEASHLVEQITPKNGEAEMPKGKPPLSQPEIDLIRRWISEGARNDTPANAVTAYDANHPPIYTRPPVIPSLDYSPDGKLLAVAGFHEVLLHKADGSGLAAPGADPMLLPRVVDHCNLSEVEIESWMAGLSQYLIRRPG